MEGEEGATEIMNSAIKLGDIAALLNTTSLHAKKVLADKATSAGIGLILLLLLSVLVLTGIIALVGET